VASDHFSSDTRPRPKWLRALGPHSAPARIEIAGKQYRKIEDLKHDSWAATSMYEGPGTERIVCKFQRQQSLFGLPMGWLGKLLARHELEILQRLADLPNVPRPCGPVHVGGVAASHAIARSFIPGHPLQRGERVRNDFFPTLSRLLAVIHRRQMAYVDLHKRENIIVGDNGDPFLIDFQISAVLPSSGPGRVLLGILAQCDEYHLAKHWAKSRPDQCGLDRTSVRERMPWWICLHRMVARPFRQLRRRLLVLISVRSGRGRAASELFAEDAVRRELCVASAPAAWSDEPVAATCFLPRARRPASRLPASDETCGEAVLCEPPRLRRVA
jgi:hypothetical protein